MLLCYSELVARSVTSDVDSTTASNILGFLRRRPVPGAADQTNLLEHTRAGVIELSEVSAVDSESILQQTRWPSLAEALRESGAIVTYDALPEVFIGEAHLHQVFQNLIANALKYRTEEPPRIHVSAGSAPGVSAVRGALCCFSVQDNGIGIDPQI